MKKKNLLIAFFIFSLNIIYIYICAIDAIPINSIIFKGEKLKYKNLIGISLIRNEEKYKTILTSTEVKKEEIQETGTQNLKVKLFNTITVKDIDVSVIERTKINPVGLISGLKLYTKGVLVVGMSEIKGIDNKKYKPYEETGLQEGDTIEEINEEKIKNTDDLIKKVNLSKGKELKIKFSHDGQTEKCSIKPVKISETEYKLGIWVRDSAAGIGTITFYEPTSKKIAILGHGITDIDTGNLINIDDGQICKTAILSIVKGKEGIPGKIQGSIDDNEIIGSIEKNSIFGIYGVVPDIAKIHVYSNNVDVALRNEIQLGEAELMCSLDGENIEKFKIDIEKIYTNNENDNKSMFIKVTDERLIEKTGGIVQGMSGSPVIQNGKFIGAVTNVLVNDPTKGYVVFGDKMIKEMNLIEN